MKQWQTIWLIAKGKTVNEVFDATGYSPGWIREIVRRYNRLGVAGVGDGRKELEDKLAERCKILSTFTTLIRAICLYHWWPLGEKIA